MPSAALCGPSKVTGLVNSSQERPPSDLVVSDVALMAERVAEVLPDFRPSIELVLRHVFRQPVARVFGEVKLVRPGAKIHSDDLSYPPSDHLRAAAVEVDAPDLCMGVRWHADVARRANLEIELVVGPDGQKLPAVRLVLRKVTIDDRRLRRVVEVVLDLFDPRDLGQLGDVERAVVKGDPIRAVEA